MLAQLAKTKPAFQPVSIVCVVGEQISPLFLVHFKIANFEEEKFSEVLWAVMKGGCEDLPKIRKLK